VNDDHHLILRVCAKLFIPLIIVYALYVQFHGELGPGGGFQAGVISAVALILHALIFGVRQTEKAVPVPVVRLLAALGALIFGGTGVVCLLLGGNFLDYNVLSEDPAHAQHGQHLGVLLIEIGVLVTVSSTMLSVFYAFAGRVPELDDRDW
jgi:multicomponent Na+:H+ antiporter subunit B